MYQLAARVMEALIASFWVRELVTFGFLGSAFISGAHLRGNVVVLCGTQSVLVPLSTESDYKYLLCSVGKQVQRRQLDCSIYNDKRHCHDKQPCTSNTM